MSQVLLYLTPELLKKSGKELYRVLTNLFKKNKLGRVLNEVDWYKNERFFIDEPIDSVATMGEWFLITMPIPESKSKNYLGQTVVLRELLRSIYKDREISDDYKTAVEELSEEKYTEIEALMKDDWKAASQVLVDLKINSNHRPSFNLTMLFFSLYLLVNREDEESARIFINIYIWTSSRASDGGFVNFGDHDFRGAGVARLLPGRSFGDVFAMLLRK